MLEHARGQQRRRPASVTGPHHGGQRLAADPPAAPLIAQDVPPPTGARGASVFVAAVADGPGAGNQHDARPLVAGAGDQRRQRVVDDQHRRLEADAAHDAGDDGVVVRAVDAGDAEADGGRRRPLAGQDAVHHLVEHFLDFELAQRLQVRAGPAGRRTHPSVAVGQQADGLGSSSVDTQHEHGRESGGGRIEARGPWAA